MDFLITFLPILVVVFIIVKEVWQTWKDGLLLTLIKLGITLVSLVLAFALTRLLLNPAWVDLFGLGRLLVEKVPADFFTVMPDTEAFLHALPTALLAIIGFTVIFDVLRINGCKLMRKLNEKHKWSEKYLKINHEKLATMGVGALSSVLCLLPESGQMIDMNALQDPALLAQIRQIVMENQNFVDYFKPDQKNSES